MNQSLVHPFLLFLTLVPPRLATVMPAVPKNVPRDPLVSQGLACPPAPFLSVCTSPRELSNSKLKSPSPSPRALPHITARRI